MRNILSVLFVFLFPLCGVAQTQPCNNYACKMELARKALQAGRYKSALDLARGAESYDASKKAEVNAFIDEVFVAIEGKRQEAERQKKAAEYQQKKAQAAERQADISRKIADEEREKSESARIEALAQKEIAVKLLDSLGKFSGREDALLKFNAFKEKGDAFLKSHAWDSAYLYLSLALRIADENPLIQVGKPEIYDNLEWSRQNIDSAKQKNAIIQQRITAAKTAMGKGDLKGYNLAFRVYSESDSTYFKDRELYMTDLITSLKMCISETNSRFCAMEDQAALEYFLMEIYEYRSDSIRRDSLIRKLSNEKLSRKRNITRSYEKNSVPVYYPRYYDKIMSHGNLIYRALGPSRERRPSVAMRIAYPATFLSNSDEFQFKNGISARVGFNAFSLFKNPGSRWYFYTDMMMEFRFHEAISMTKGNFQYNNAGFSTTLYDVERHHKGNNSRFSLTFNSKITVNLKKEYALTLGAGINTGVIQEAYSAGQTIFYTDTTIVIPGQIRSSFQAFLGLPSNNSKYLALGGNLEFFITRLYAPKTYSKIYRSKVAIDLGMRLSTDFYLFNAGNQSFYQELYENYGVVGGRKMTVAEVFIGVRGPFYSTGNYPTGPVLLRSVGSMPMF